MSPFPPPGLSGAITIAGHELRSMLLSPLAWILLALVQLVVGIVFVVQLQVFLDPPRAAALAQGWGLTRVVAAPVVNWAAFLLLLCVPLLAMRAVSEERRNHALTLLLCAPLRPSTIVLGKYLGLVGFLAIQIACVLLLPLLLLSGSDLDLGLLGAQAMGLGAVASAFSSLGVWMSSLTRQPTVAAVATASILLVLWLLSWRPPGSGSWVHQLSWQIHLEPLLRGLVSTADLTYFAVLTGFCLWAGSRQVARLRR